MFNFKVNDRIVYKGLSGTIRYIGCTKYPGIWYGLELDTPNGKNDGSYDGKTYFTCEDKHGLFVQLSDLKKEDTQSNFNKENRTDTLCIQKSSSDNNIDKFNTNRSKLVPPKTNLRQSRIPNLNSNSEINIIKTDNSDDKDLKIQSLQKDLDNLRLLKRQHYDKSKLTEKNLKEQIAVLNEKNGQLESEMVASNEIFESLKQEKAQLVEELKQLRDQNEMHDFVETLTIDKEILEERCEQLQENNDNLTETLEKLNQEIAYLKNESDIGIITPADVSKYKEAIVQINNQLIQKNKECEDKDKEIDSGLEKQIIAEKQIKQLQDESDVLRRQNNELMQAAISREDLETMVNRLTMVNLELEEEMERLKAQLNEVDNQSDQKTIELIQKNEELSALKHIVCDSELKLYNAELEKNNEIQNLQQELHRIKDEFENKVTDLTKTNQELMVNKSSINQIQENLRDSEVILKSSLSDKRNCPSRIMKQKLKEFEVMELSEKLELLTKFIPKDLFKMGVYVKVVDTYVYLKVLLDKIDSLIEQIQVLKSDSTIITISSKFESSSYMNRTIFLLEILKPCIRIVVSELENCEQAELDAHIYNHIDIKEKTSIINEHLQLIVQDCYSESRSLSRLESCINYFLTQIMGLNYRWKQKLLSNYQYRVQYNKLQSNLMLGNGVYYGCVCLIEMIDWVCGMGVSKLVEADNHNDELPDAKSNFSNSSWIFRIKRILEQLKSQSHTFVRTYEKEQSNLSFTMLGSNSPVLFSHYKDSFVVNMLNIVGAFSDASHEFMIEPSLLRDPVSAIVNKLKVRYSGEETGNSALSSQYQDIRLKLLNMQLSLQQMNDQRQSIVTYNVDEENSATKMKQVKTYKTCLEKCAHSVTTSFQQLSKNTIDLQHKTADVSILNQKLTKKSHEIDEHKIRADLLNKKLNDLQVKYNQLSDKHQETGKLLTSVSDKSGDNQAQFTDQTVNSVVMDTITRISIGINTDDRGLNHQSYEDRIRTLRDIVANQRLSLYRKGANREPLPRLPEIKRIDEMVNQAERNRLHLCRIELYDKLSSITIKTVL